MARTGHVVAVLNGEIQTHLTADAAVAATVLTVESTHQFNNEAGGDMVAVADQDPIAIVSATDTTITLASGLLVAASDGEPVTLVRGGQRATFWDAEVDFGAEEPVPVPVPFEQRAMWPAGTYDPAVPVLVADDLSQIVDAPTRTPVISGVLIETASGGYARVSIESSTDEADVDRGLVKFQGTDLDWEGAYLWASFVAGDHGRLRIASPFYVPTVGAEPAVIELTSTQAGVASMNLIADTYELGAGASSVDLNAAFSDQISLRGQAGQRINFGFLFGYNTIVSRNEDAIRNRLDIDASDIHFQVGGEELVMMPATAVARPIIANSALNSALLFGDSGSLRATNAGGTGFIPIEASAFTVSSDGANKSNFDPVVGALDSMCAVSIVDYDTTQGAPDGGTVRARGIVAQELADVEPLLVKEPAADDDGGLTVDLYGLLTTTIAAVQELKAEVETLKCRVAELEGC